MAPKKKTRSRKFRNELPDQSSGLLKSNGTTRIGNAMNGHDKRHHEQNGHSHHMKEHHDQQDGVITLRTQTAHALDTYFTNLNGHIPGELYDLVIREVEEPLFRAVLGYVEGNQSRAAEVLGINRGTLRKKLREYGLHDAP